MSGPRESDALAHAVAQTSGHLIQAIPGAWMRAGSGCYAGVSTVPVAQMNGAVVIEPGCDPQEVRELLGEVARSELPYSILMRPQASDELLALAGALGLHPHDPVPLLALDGPPAGVESALVLRTLVPEEAALHCEVGAAGFGMPREILEVVASPAVLGLAGVRAYVGELDGTAVTTALLVQLGRFAGIFNVATLPQHRRRGYGAAITAFAARDARSEGSEAVWLQSSPMGLGVYERLGFELVESWRCWLSVDPGESS